MNTETTEYKKTKATVFYDGECDLCKKWVARASSALTRHGFDFVPQQAPLGRDILGLKEGEVLPEVKVRTHDKTILGGIDALLYLAPFIWWTKPLGWFAQWPGGKNILCRAYRFIAQRRRCFNGKCTPPPK